MRPLHLLLVLSLSGTLAARPVSIEDGLQAATNWLTQQDEAPQNMRLAETIPLLGSDGTAQFYMHHFEPSGFLLMSAEDLLPPVLGYSFNHTAPSELNHPAVAAYINSVRVELEWAQESLSQNQAAAMQWQTLMENESLPARDRDRDISPMLLCTWDQGWPWNRLCPEDNSGSGGHVWAGCVAVAMAQVMHYWQAPLQGRSSYSYTHPAYGEQSANFGETEYEWDSMHNSQGTEAAALLLYHAGVAVHMDYSPSGSGAFVGSGQQSAMHGMEVYFRFPESLSFAEKTDYPGEEWAELLRAELDAGRPILHRGYGSGGHAFNIDGYQENGFFHLNWGWSGYANGWFLIDELTPGSMDFSFQQGAVIGLEANSAPLVDMPDQEVNEGTAFPELVLDEFVIDGQTSAENIIWWTEGGSPLDVSINYATRRATVTYPQGWTGTVSVNFCASDLDNLTGCDEVLFTVVEYAGEPMPPLAITDLRVRVLPPGVRLDWTTPETDVSGFPVQILSFGVYGGSNPWFQPSSATLLGSTEEPTYLDLSSDLREPRFYRVISHTP
jgi:hypothetical protein